jgi:IMP dehydrogenase
MRWYNDNQKEQLTYDDVLIVPDYSELSSRLDANPYIKFGKHEIAPFMVANMDSLANYSMWEALTPLKVLVPFHRFQKIEHEVECVKKASENWMRYDPTFDPIAGTSYISPFIAASVGINDVERVDKVAKYANILFLDVAHADNKFVIEETKRIKKSFPDHLLVVGNVATREATSRLVEAGADIIKTGTGSGAICITRGVTGSGFPQLSAIDHCSPRAPTIADGGIRSSGDICKALAAGADCAMTGALFAGTDESMGHGTDHRIYRGLASKDAQEDFNGKLPDGIVPEGISVRVPYKGRAVSVAKDLIAGVRQGMAMVGAATIEEFRNKAKFVRVSQATITENGPHILLGKGSLI